MTGKGWTWIGTDGATTSPFVESPNLQLAMQGMVGTRPKHGEGALYQKLLKTWKEKDASMYPGPIHSPRVLQVRLYFNYPIRTSSIFPNDFLFDVRFFFLFFLVNRFNQIKSLKLYSVCS